MSKPLEYCFAFFLIAALLEGSAYVLSKTDPSNDLAVFDGIRLDDSVFTLKRNYTQRWRTDDFDVVVATNSDGFREDKDFSLKDLDVAFFGDSFTFGWGVNNDQKYTNIFAKYFPDRIIASLAIVCGFQPEHYEFYLNSHRALAPKLAVVGLYLGNDLESDVRETWINKSQDGRIYDVQLPYRDVFRGLLVNASTYKFQGISFLARHSYFFGYVLSRLNRSRFREYLFEGDTAPGSPNSLDTERGHFGELSVRSLDSLRRLNSIVKERGGRLIVLIIPQNYFVTLTGNLHIRHDLVAEIPALLSGSNIKTAVETFCTESALDCLDPTRVLTAEDYFVWDSHWNSGGHAKLGKLLAKHVESTGGVQ